ncbi:hypothetical protein GHT06_009877 [Daphnia sinensis]|uniref:Copia protein n=1 Tax=Daphnia sinensis TaxID=1820382 RepID=A0AAD5LI32_9CRUS|nr:hypothetical protein GHT06_009877 [Daphnia sinensis]
MASSISKDVNHIVKFDGSSFPLWKFGCWLLLEQQNPIQIVDGRETLPEETKNEEDEITNMDAINNWKQRDVLARSYLIATIEKQPQRTLLNCRTAFEMWTRLTSHLQCAAENKHLLQKQFYDYKYKPGIYWSAQIVHQQSLGNKKTDQHCCSKLLMIFLKY